METILTGLGIFILVLIIVLYGIPLVGSLLMILFAAIKDGVPKSERWIVWLFSFLAFVPLANIIVFIALIHSKHN